MFLAHISFALELIAIAIGSSLFIWGMRSHGAGIIFAKVLGIIIIAFAAVDLLCTAYTGVLYGSFTHSYYSSMTQNPMKDSGGECPMCTKMKKDRTSKSANSQADLNTQAAGHASH